MRLPLRHHHTIVPRHAKREAHIGIFARDIQCANESLDVTPVEIEQLLAEPRRNGRQAGRVSSDGVQRKVLMVTDARAFDLACRLWLI